MDGLIFGTTTNSEAATVRLGAALGPLLLAGDLVKLEGPLGVGKSTFARGLIRGLTSPDEEVPSPTFALVQQYDTANFILWHLDLYRLDKPQDIRELGFEEALDEGVCLIEWSDKAEAMMPVDALKVVLSQKDAEERLVTFWADAAYSEGWAGRLDGLKKEVQG